MSKPLPISRNFLLNDEIESNTIKDVIQGILNVNESDNDREQEYKDWVREPILVFINSPGGSVYNGLALVDIIKRSKTPVYTICIGHAMSMGLWIFMAGHKRLIGSNATLMFHDISTYMKGKTEYVKQELEEMNRLQKMLIDEITSKSLVKTKQLEDYIEKKSEWYIPAAQAISLELADSYY